MNMTTYVFLYLKTLTDVVIQKVLIGLCANLFCIVNLLQWNSLLIDVAAHHWKNV